MILKFKLGITLIIIFLFQSCTEHIFEPALYQNDIVYQPKPSSLDIKKSSFYISGAYGQSTTSNISLSTNIGELEISRAHVFKVFNLSYGLYGLIGSEVNGDSKIDSLVAVNPFIFKSKSFSALGARLSMNLLYTHNRMDFRYLGFEVAYSHEMGDYLAYRKQVYPLPGYYSSTLNNLVTLGGTTEIVFSPEKSFITQYSFRLFIGQTFGKFSSLNDPNAIALPHPDPQIRISCFLQSRQLFLGLDLKGIDPFSSNAYTVKGGFKF
jgi:hypothetical protein